MVASISTCRRSDVELAQAPLDLAIVAGGGADHQRVRGLVGDDPDLARPHGQRRGPRDAPRAPVRRARSGCSGSERAGVAPRPQRGRAPRPMVGFAERRTRSSRSPSAQGRARAGRPVPRSRSWMPKTLAQHVREIRRAAVLDGVDVDARLLALADLVEAARSRSGRGRGNAGCAEITRIAFSRSIGTKRTTSASGPASRPPNTASSSVAELRCGLPPRAETGRTTCRPASRRRNMATISLSASSSAGAPRATAHCA